MRSSRLVALLMELSRARRTTVSVLAARHGVSERTIQRDLAALGEIGAPVWTRTGPDGGVGLVEGWRSPLTGMTAAEVQALLLGEAGARDLGLEGHLETARVKMLATRTAGAEVGESTVERFHVDQGRWFEEPERPAALADVAHAVWTGRRLGFRYRRPHRAPAEVRRLVDPLGLVLKADQWYLVAAHRRQVRTYRVSRIESAEVREQEAWRLEGFELGRYWAESRSAFEGGVYTVPVRLTIPESSGGALRAALPGVAVDQALEEASRDEGRLQLDLRTERLEIVSHQLLGVPGVKVLEPAELRERLYVRGVDLASHNALAGSREGGLSVEEGETYWKAE